MMQFFIIAGVLLLIAVFAYLGYLERKRRREEMANLAAELGWQFSPHHDASHDDQYAHFEIFRRGHSRYAYNTLTGDLDVEGVRYPARLGDFMYKVTSGSGKNRRTTTYRFSYLILHLPYPRVPSMLIRPEGMFDKVAGFMGFDDIDFESAEFSRRFYVKGDDKRFCYDVIDPRMMQFLLDSEPPTVDIEHGRSCFSDGRRRWSAAECKAMLGWVRTFFEHWPDHVKTTLQNS